MATHHVLLYGKEGCCLCEKAFDALQRLQQSVAFTLETKDITDDPELFRSFRYRIPIIMVDGEQACAVRVDEAKMRTLLA
uniref:Glutaredoxin 2 n=1 Tax=Chlorobium chlorochromatii (strain CaD3) TaxID=340177 RepID=Q3AQK3_CHLCH